MTNPTLLDPVFYFLNGAVCMGALACGLFFFRSWGRSRDRLFLIFGVAFWLMGLERVVFLALRAPNVEDHAAIYSFRLLAFLMILGAIWDKNRSRAPRAVFGP